MPGNGERQDEREGSAHLPGRRHIAKGDVEDVVERSVLEAVTSPCRAECLLGEDRDMAVARSDIPPRQTLIVEVGWLRQRRVEHRSRLSDAFGHPRDAGDGIWQMFEGLERRDQIELALGAGS